jgi:hypothetical protein
MTVCGRGRKLIALKVCVTGVHILGWQKSSNSCVNADRSVYRSLPQWGKHYLTTHHTKKMENSGNPNTHHLVHTNKIVPNDSCSIGVGVMWHESNTNTNLMKLVDTIDLRLSFIIQLIAAGVL